MSVSLKWGDDLSPALASLSDRVSRRVQREALTDAGEVIARRMAILAPQGDPEPPNLRNEIGVAPARGQDAKEIVVAVGPSRRVYYSSFVELGTAYQAARPFARPAFDENTHKALEIIGASLWRELAARKVFRKTVTAPSVVQGER